MDAACTRIYQLGQCIDIGAQQFLQPAVFEYLANDCMFVAQTFEYFFRGNILAGFGLFGFFYDFEFVEQHFTYLLGRGDVESFTICQCIDFFFDFLQAESEMFGRLLESFCINAYSVAFNVDKYRYEWHFNFIKEMFGRLLFQFLFKYVLQL